MPPLLIDIPQMIDLALGTPEIGVVNFSVLHSVLHAITEVLSLEKYRVEFRGNYGVNVEKLIHHIPLQPILTVQEFKVDSAPGQEHKVEQRTLVTKQRDEKFDKILVIRKTEEMDTEEDNSGRAKRPIQQPVQIVSQEDFRKLGRTGGSIHDPVGRYLPNNQDVIDSARGESEGSSNPVGEMWHVLNVTKRLDATEVAIEKLTSMMRDITDEYRKTTNSVARLSAMADVSHLVDKIDMLEKTVHDNIGKQPRASRAARVVEDKPMAPKQDAAPAGVAVVAAAAGVPSAAPSQYDVPGGQMDRKPGGATEAPEPEQAYHRDSEMSENLAGPIADIIDDVFELKGEVEKLKGLVESYFASPKSGPEVAPAPAPAEGSMPPTMSGPPQLIPAGRMPGLGDSDMRNISRRTELLETKMSTVEHQIFDLEKEVAEMVDRFEDDGRPSTGLNVDLAGMADIFARVTGIKADLESTIERCNFLVVERDKLAESMEVITKKMDDFKLTKVDRDEIDELLAEKADYTMLQRKVSIDQFDATKRHLTNGLVEALDKLSEQGGHWDKAIDEVKAMTINKVGREELAPLREYIDGKIYAMQERLKAMAALRRDPEAAGTKAKFLRQVNCISCDQEVLMRLDEPSPIPKAGAVAAPSALKPFLVYELDSIRKQLKDPQTRNLHHFETMTKGKSPAAVDGRGNKLANRYCGGSHTIITPQDRVQRCKFDRKSMTPECFIKTDEGCYYKAMKKHCICPNRPGAPPGAPKLITSARTSKTQLEVVLPDAGPTKLEGEAGTLDVIKDAHSVRSSKSEIRDEKPQEEGKVSASPSAKQVVISASPSKTDVVSAKGSVHDFVPVITDPDEAEADEAAASAKVPEQASFERETQAEQGEEGPAKVEQPAEGEQQQPPGDNPEIVPVAEEVPEQDT